MCNADNTNNKKYWNDYVTYWETRVESANDGSEKKDKTPDDILLEYYFNLLSVKETDAFLDFGCGSGRLFPIFENRTGTGGNYMGIDISRVSLEHAQQRFPQLRINERLFEYDGLTVPFENNSFDKIVSFGVFDACSQEEILMELLRVLKPGGELFITGKNCRYHADDEQALTAEINARKKGHPNHFTDVRCMREQLEHRQFKIEREFFFIRRGDFARNVYKTQLPPVFYEWALLIEKGDASRTDGVFSKFSGEYSETFLLSDDAKKGAP